MWTGDPNGGFGFPKIVCMDEVYNNRALYYPDGKMHVLAGIKYFVPCPEMLQIDDESSSADGPSSPKKRRIIKELIDSMIVFSRDIILKLSDGSELRAFVSKLTEHSTVFADLLSPKNLEKLNGVLEVSGISRKVMIALLHFVYCGEVEDVDDISMELFKAACDFKIEKLQEICTKSIIETDLDYDNVIEVLKLADAHQNAKMFVGCCKTIKL